MRAAALRCVPIWWRRWDFAAKLARIRTKKGVGVEVLALGLNISQKMDISKNHKYENRFKEGVI